MSNENKLDNIEQSSTPMSFKNFYFSSVGSIGRKEFFYRGFLPLTALLFLIAIIRKIDYYSILIDFEKTGIYERGIFSYFAQLSAIAVLVAIIFVTIKRLHDTNSSGWWSILSILVPLFQFFLFFMPSKFNESYGKKSCYDFTTGRKILAVFNVVVIVASYVIFLMMHALCSIEEDKISKQSGYNLEYKSKE